MMLYRVVYYQGFWYFGEYYRHMWFIWPLTPITLWHDSTSTLQWWLDHTSHFGSINVLESHPQIWTFWMTTGLSQTIVNGIAWLLLSGSCNLRTNISRDVMTWKHFPYYWPFVSWIHWSLRDCVHQRPVTRRFDFFFDVSLVWHQCVLWTFSIQWPMCSTHWCICLIFPSQIRFYFGRVPLYFSFSPAIIWFFYIYMRWYDIAAILYAS